MLRYGDLAYGLNPSRSWPRLRLADRDPIYGPGEHLHFCPECYGNEPCSFSCSCPEDLTLDDGTQRGSPAICENCCDREGVDKW